APRALRDAIDILLDCCAVHGVQHGHMRATASACDLPGHVVDVRFGSAGEKDLRTISCKLLGDRGSDRPTSAAHDGTLLLQAQRIAHGIAPFSELDAESGAATTATPSQGETFDRHGTGHFFEGAVSVSCGTDAGSSITLAHKVISASMDEDRSALPKPSGDQNFLLRCRIRVIAIDHPTGHSRPVGTGGQGMGPGQSFAEGGIAEEHDGGDPGRASG